MTIKIGILDCGNSNIMSVKRAVQYVSNAQCVSCKTPDDISAVDKLIIPGVGAFPDGMKRIKANNLTEAICEANSAGKEMLGICLGMQLLADIGFEFSKCAGLKIIPGKVIKIDDQGLRQLRLTVPFVGWAKIDTSNSKCKTLDTQFHNEAFYFVHSYEFVPAQNEHRIANYTYGKKSICAAVGNENILGVQFHPEKSGSAGLKLIKKFVDFR